MARSFGGIAQLGERLHGMQEVSGSIPLTSTKEIRSLSSRGLGHRPFTAATGVRIPVGTPSCIKAAREVWQPLIWSVAPARTPKGVEW